MAFVARGPFFLHQLSGHQPTKARPVALLLGWTNGTHQHVQKYVPLYHKLEMDVIVQINTAWHVVSESGIAEQIRQHGKKIFEEYAILGKDSTNFCIIHVFSNGGVNGLRILTEVLAEQNSVLNAQALIIDSAPGGLTFMNGVNAMTAHIRSPVFQLFMKVLVGFFFVIQVVVFFFLRRQLNLQQASDRLRLSIPYSCPRLYLYSKKDQLIPFKEVEEHAEKTKNNSVQIELKRWDDSEHVQHFRRYPEEYQKTVTTFLSTIIRNPL